MLNNDAKDDDWNNILTDHPIFSLPKNVSEITGGRDLELSTNTLNKFANPDNEDDTLTPSGRRQVMILKNDDLIVAAGSELRMTSLNDSKLGRSTRKSYKVLHTPNVQFEIHQLSLNPNGKLLAVAGSSQVAVVVLPRSGYSRLVPSAIDCKSIQVGQFYHASHASAPIAKIQWHPWGEAGSTLMVMTIDGKMREYDISVDTEEPQQVLTFVPEKKTKSYLAEDYSEREVASFILGRGTADWGPLTIYAIMKSGDIYSICPYMPRNASIPSLYIHALGRYIEEKVAFLAESKTPPPKSQSTLYNYQSLYIKGLIAQIPSDVVLGASSRSVLLHPPATVQHKVLRQGPFLLQPSPRMLEGGEGGDATDIVYLAFGGDDDDLDGDLEGATERLGVVLIAYQDGKVDVCLDVQKTEAAWETRSLGRELPMLAVYETIDLGLISTLKSVSGSTPGSSMLELLQGNHPVFHADPIHDDVVYVYHAFGVHALHIGPMLQTLAVALRVDGDDADAELNGALQKCVMTNVQPILTTFSVERKCSNPVLAVTVPNDVYLTYSIFVLTSAWRICSFPLDIGSDPHQSDAQDVPAIEDKEPGRFLRPADGPPAHISLLTEEPFTLPAILSRRSGLPSNPRLAIGSSGTKEEFKLTPDSLRYLGKVVTDLANQMHEVLLANHAVSLRSDLQKSEFQHQQGRCGEMMAMMEQLKGPRYANLTERVQRIRDSQKALSARQDRILQNLVQQASPELSEHEKKWFDELKRMKEEVAGAGRYDEGSLAARARLLEREYDRLLPSLNDFSKREAERKKKHADNQESLGFSQAFELGEKSNQERERISAIEREILKLASKLEISVGRPPSQKDQDSSKLLLESS